MRPRIVCLCGSTRFALAYQEANMSETRAGRIVLSVGGYTHAEGLSFTPDQKWDWDMLHLHKIDLADEILVINVNGYVGPSTAQEIAYAAYTHKTIRFIEATVGAQYLIRERERLAAHVASFNREGIPHLAKDRVRTMAAYAAIPELARPQDTKGT